MLGVTAMVPLTVTVAGPAGSQVVASKATSSLLALQYLAASGARPQCRLFLPIALYSARTTAQLALAVTGMVTATPGTSGSFGAVAVMVTWACAAGRARRAATARRGRAGLRMLGAEPAPI